MGGFGSDGLIAVSATCIVAAGLRDTGAVPWIARRPLGRPTTVWAAQLRLMGPVAAFSAFLNNTPPVAIMIPAVREWTRRLNVSPSKLLMHPSYAAVLGGTITLIDTSTDLAVAGPLVDKTIEAAGLRNLAHLYLVELQRDGDIVIGSAIGLGRAPS